MSDQNASSPNEALNRSQWSSDENDHLLMRPHSPGNLMIVDDNVVIERNARQEEEDEKEEEEGVLVLTDAERGRHGSEPEPDTFSNLLGTRVRRASGAPDGSHGGSIRGQGDEDPTIGLTRNLSPTYGSSTFAGTALNRFGVASDQNNSHGESLVSSFATSYTPHMRDRIRRKLKYFFMNPVDKWRAKGRLPWKLGLQVIKIVVVTLQVVMLGLNMSRYLMHQGNMVVTFRELFLINWDPVREVMTYPPAAGPYAIYSKGDFYESVDYAIQVYSNITQNAIGTFGYGRNSSADNPMSPISLCKEYYSLGEAIPSEYFYNYTNTRKQRCIEIEPLHPPGDDAWKEFSIKDYLLDYHNMTICFNRLLKIIVRFPLRTIYLNSLDPSDEPECYDVNVTITYDNTQHDGQMLVSLNSKSSKHKCKGNLNNTSDRNTQYELIALNVLVVFLCAMSFVLCSRSLFKGQQLRCEVVAFFRSQFGRELSFPDQCEFIDCWIVTIIINDCLIVSGSIIKIMMEFRITEYSHFNACSVLLGVGNLLVWTGVLRYLGFFQKYNILILTLKRALPHVLRFMLCAILLYAGFCFCGWVVLGPYHLKFRTLSTTSECLFALLNGDDMFATFAVTNTDDPLIWWFSRIYLYLFIALFIYVVLSLFISIIMDSYETIKEFYETGFPLSDLQRFIAECPDEPSSSVYLHDQEDGITTRVGNYFGRLFGRQSSYDIIE